MNQVEISEEQQIKIAKGAALVALLTLAVVFVIYSIVTAPSSPSASSPASEHHSDVPSIGDRVLETGGFFCPTSDELADYISELSSSRNAHDPVGTKEALLKGALHGCFIDSSPKQSLLIDASWSSRRVRFDDGSAYWTDARMEKQ